MTTVVYTAANVNISKTEESVVGQASENYART
jgi:hypothetical protein